MNEQLLTVLNNVANTLKENTLLPVAAVLVILTFTLIFGGNNEKIQNAKKVIGGGIVGLTLWVFLIPLAETVTGWFIF